MRVGKWLRAVGGHLYFVCTKVAHEPSEPLRTTGPTWCDCHQQPPVSRPARTRTKMFPTSPLKHTAKKEKSKFTPQAEFTDLDPLITYKHILFPPPGVRDPLRVIALCDSDAFYAACEQVRLGIDPSRPLVVRQWDALIAVNYPARAFGITRMRHWREAVKKCPELIVVHVATYKEGDKSPAYHDNPDTATHKVCSLTSQSSQPGTGPRANDTTTVLSRGGSFISTSE